MERLCDLAEMDYSIVLAMCIPSHDELAATIPLCAGRSVGGFLN